MRAVGDVPEPPVSPPVMGAPERGPVPAPAAPTEAARPFTVEELRTLPLQALLVRSGALTIEQLSEALRVNVATGQSVEDIAIERGWVSAEQVSQLVAAKLAVAPEPVPEAPAPAPVAPVAAAPEPQPIQPVQQVPPVQPAEPVQQVQAVETPQPTAQYAAPAPAPMPAPGAAVPPAPAEEPSNAEKSVGVFLNLTDGQRVWVGRFATEADAERRAQEVIQAFVRPEPGVWPRFGGRFIRPDAVVSVELSKRRED